jgi:hypothetical protein
LSTGRLSPVSMDSSTAERPSRIRPSTGIFSPGRTESHHQPPQWNIDLRPLRITRAAGARPISCGSLRVCPLARFSGRPNRIKAMIGGAVEMISASIRTLKRLGKSGYRSRGRLTGYRRR